MCLAGLKSPYGCIANSKTVANHADYVSRPCKLEQYAEKEVGQIKDPGAYDEVCVGSGVYNDEHYSIETVTSRSLVDELDDL